ncbi:MAG: LPXTG cell wall anchor domain-containing protein [Propionibacteriaceae bacterium]|jgi:LPXTG-motif cell wall-anchored protein|nr:LPXTG cell wall anchor domain-containing protein [Propionibacteriaceae bacterium]
MNLSTPVRHGRKRLPALIAAAALAAGALLAFAPAAPALAAGYDTMPSHADGSKDFSAWTPLRYSPGATVGGLDLVRNGIAYNIEVRFPSGTNHPLFSNQIKVEDASDPHTYVYSRGSSSTSYLWHRQAGQTARTAVSPTAVEYYALDSGDNLSVAWTGQWPISNGPTLLFSDVLDVTADGALTHHLTITNPSDTPVSGYDFFVSLDTMLDANDRIPIIKSARDWCYINNDDFRLYLGLLQGDQFYAGDWRTDDNLSDYVDVNDPSFDSGAELVTGVDTAVDYGLIGRAVAPRSSITLAYQERVYENFEIQEQTVDVVYVDSLGQVVTPTAGAVTVLTGEPLASVGYTEAMALAGMPSGYELVSIDNVSEFDDDNEANQTITVHLYRLSVVQVNYVDDDAAGALTTPTAGTQTMFTGTAGEPVGFTADAARAGAPAAYDIVVIDNVGQFDDDPGDDQVITVHLVHRHDVSEADIARLIVYTGAGDATPPAVEQQALWQVDRDLVTGVAVYTTAGAYDAVVTPELAGYTVDIAEVPALSFADPITADPAQLMAVVVTYTSVLPDTGSNPYSLATLLGGAGFLILAGLLLVSRDSLQAAAR